MRLLVFVFLLAPVLVLCEPPAEGNKPLPADKLEKIENVKSVICREGILASLVKDVWAKIKPVTVETRALSPKKIRLAFGMLARLYRLCDESLEEAPAPMKPLSGEQLELPLPDDVIPRLCEVKDLEILLTGIAEKLKEKLPETKRKLPPIFRALTQLGEIYKENCPIIAQRNEDEPKLPKPEMKEEIKEILCGEVITKLVEQLKGLKGTEEGFVEVEERKFKPGLIPPIYPMKTIPRLIKAHSKICIEKADDPTVVAIVLRMLEEREVNEAGKGKGPVKGPVKIKVILEGISEELLKGLKATVCAVDVKNLFGSLVKPEKEGITETEKIEERDEIPPRPKLPPPPPRVLLRRFGRLVEVLCETEVPAAKPERREEIPAPDPEVKALVCEGKIPALVNDLAKYLLDLLHSTEEDADDEELPEIDDQPEETPGVPKEKRGKGKGGKGVKGPMFIPIPVMKLFGLIRHQQLICRVKDDTKPEIPLKELFKELKHIFKEEMEAGDEESPGLLGELHEVIAKRMCSEEIEGFFKELKEKLEKLKETIKEKNVARRVLGVKPPIIFLKRLLGFRTKLCTDVAPEQRGAPEVPPPKLKSPPGPQAWITALEELLGEQ